jgi:hypothetical protein
VISPTHIDYHAVVTLLIVNSDGFHPSDFACVPFSQ